jgi:hypothetical protein
MYYIKDDNGIKSQTTTLVWVGIITASVKLILAGSTFAGVSFGEFSGSDYAMVVAPFLALLAHKRHVNKDNKKPPTDGDDSVEGK